jgi:SSS family solute:Na+ symporter/sodium/pantothenate symporter
MLGLTLFTIASLLLGVVANKVALGKAGFLRRYFLGNRSMGALAVALTAAVMSGGTFLGFPSLVYSFGWVVGLWIASYMVAPLTVLGILGKRIGQLARRCGAITLPDLFRERYGSGALGLLSSLLIIFFLSVFLVAQFKAGAVIIQEVLPSQVYGWLGGNAGTPTADVHFTGYVVGLVVFAATVIAYTTYGGFLAAIWTDVFQSLVMALGVLILLPLALAKVGGLAAATNAGIALAGPRFAFGPGAQAPGIAGHEFHPIGLAFSFFVMWAISGMGQPSTLVRLMAFRDSRTLRYSIIWQCLYNALIYIPLIFIFIAARSLLPDMVGRSDRIMPRLVISLTNPYLAGLILAAPYGAVMSTVSGFLLLVSSALIRDVYQRYIRPLANERELAFASYIATILVGFLVAVVALNAPQYLQLIIIFASGGMASAFLAPAVLGAFWRRATASGAIASMLVGTTVMLGLYALGIYGPNTLGLGGLLPPNPLIGAVDSFRPYYLLGLDPCVWGLSCSFLVGIFVSLATRPPEPKRVALLFDAVD